MKKLLMIALMVGLILPSFAQKGIEIGARVMPQLSLLMNADDFDAGPELDLSGSHFGMAFGFDVGYNFSDNAGIALQLLVSSIGQDYEGNFGSLPMPQSRYSSFVELILVQDALATGSFSSYTAETKLSYLKIPLLFRYNTDPEATAMFEMSFGPHVNLLTGAEHLYLDSETAYTLSGVTMETKDLYTSTNFGVSIALGAGFNLVENLQLSTGIRMEYDFGDLEDKDVTVLTIPVWAPERRSTASASLGFFLGLSYVIGM